MTRRAPRSASRLGRRSPTDAFCFIGPTRRAVRLARQQPGGLQIETQAASARDTRRPSLGCKCIGPFCLLAPLLRPLPLLALPPPPPPPQARVTQFGARECLRHSPARATWNLGRGRKNIYSRLFFPQPPSSFCTILNTKKAKTKLALAASSAPRAASKPPPPPLAGSQWALINDCQGWRANCNSNNSDEPPARARRLSARQER